MRRLKITTDSYKSHQKLNQRGFHLIESLITLFVLTVGILGIVGLQAISISSQRDSSYKSQAILMAQNIIERARSNRYGLLKGYYDQADDNAGSSDSSCYTAAGCNAEKMAKNDIFEWQQLLNTMLPEGKGIICKSSVIPSLNDLAGDDLRAKAQSTCNGIGNNYVVHVMWEKINAPGEDNLKLTFKDEKIVANSSDGYLQLSFSASGESHEEE